LLVLDWTPQHVLSVQSSKLQVQLIKNGSWCAHLTSCRWFIFTNTFSGNHNVNAAAVFILSCARHYVLDAETMTMVSELIIWLHSI